MSQQLITGFIKTNQRACWIVFLSIQGQNGLHSFDEKWRNRGDTPAFYQPGLWYNIFIPFITLVKSA
jgi:hypothetical protein